jgi:hypothetical protein
MLPADQPDIDPADVAEVETAVVSIEAAKAGTLH